MMLRRFRPALLAAVFFAAGCGNGSGLGGPSTTATATPQNLYVANAPSQFGPVPGATPSVTVYTIAPNAGTAPSRTLAGPATGFPALSIPSGVTLDAAGNLYVAVTNATGNASSINVYSPGTSGNVAPAAVIPQNQNVSGVALAGGRVYTLGTNALLGFAVPGSNLAPVTIAVPPPAPYALASDRFGNLYILNQIGIVYSYPSGSSTPSSALNVQIDTGVPAALTIDKRGYLYAGSDGTVQVYASGASGNAPPVRTIGGSATALRSIQSLAVDALGYLYVADTQLNGIAVFAPNANGNVAPVSTLLGASAGINTPRAIAVGP